MNLDDSFQRAVATGEQKARDRVARLRRAEHLRPEHSELVDMAVHRAAELLRRENVAPSAVELVVETVAVAAWARAGEGQRLTSAEIDVIIAMFRWWWDRWFREM
ncbi:hypothetical protein ACWCW7_21950 [Nocardia tengchongensis]